MRRAALVLVLALAVVVVVVAIAGRDDQTDEAASSCTSTLVAANAGTDADPELTLYQGTSSRRLTLPGSNSVQPSFSPDGEELAFIRSDTAWGDGGPLATELWVIPTTGDDSGGRSVVAEPGRRTDPAWSPDGAEIAFIEQRLSAGSSADVHEVRVVDRTGGQPRTIAEIPGASNLDWSPDGNEILVSTYDAEDGTLLLLDPADGSTTTVAEDATMGVLADDSTVYFLDRIEPGSWQLAVGTLDGRQLDRRTRLGDDRVYAYGFFGLDAAPCGPER